MTGPSESAELAIGQVGLGGITVAHRDGYRIYDQPVVAGFDPSAEARERFLADSPGASVYETLDDLLADPRVGVIDLATPHHRSTRLPLIQQIAAAGKPVLVQKPLAYTYPETVEIVEVFEKYGTVGMVNQNMAFTPGSLRLIDAVMTERAIGEPAFAQVSVQYIFDLDFHPWFGKDDRWWTGALTVHHFGLLQLLFGPPATVYAITGHDPGQPGVTSDGFGHLLMRYPSGMSVAVTSTGTYYGTDPVPHGNEKIWIQGSDGIADWRPEGGLDISRRSGGGEFSRERITWNPEEKWFPHAFGLTMAHFRAALADGATPLCSASDNLYVMAVIEAAYQSSEHNRVVPIAEIMGDRYDPDYGTGWSHGYSDWVSATLSGAHRD